MPDDDTETTETEVVEAETPEGGSTLVVVDNSGSDDDTETPAEDGDTTVLVVEEGGNDEGAQDDATQLDHEQRITRTEDGLAMLAAALSERPTFEEVRDMTPSYSEVIDTAADVATAVVEAEQEAEATDSPEGVRVEEPSGDPTDPVIAVEEPSAPEATSSGRKSSLFRW